MQTKKVIVVLGPTASGKTALALELAKHHHTAVVSADSRQVYREMKIGTARPDEKELEGIPHFCLGHVSIHDNYNAGQFEKDALQALKIIFETNSVAIVCGGTGMYINALLYGLDDLPEADLKLRKEIDVLESEKGLIGLQEKLNKLDPEFFLEIDSNNPQRLKRAIEICLLTGRSNLELKKKTVRSRDFTWEKIGIDLEREALYERINARVDNMIEQGLLAEAKHLYAYKNLPALKTVGYSEIFDFLDKKISWEDCVIKIKQHSRNYAKRQLTWFRKDKEINWRK